MKKTIIFLTVYPFNHDYAKKYGLDYLNSKGIDVIIINVIKLLHSDVIGNLPDFLKIDQSLNIKQINVDSIKHIEDVLLKIKGNVFVIFLCRTEKDILRILKIHNTDYILVKNSIHNFLINIPVTLRFIKLIRENNLFEIIKKIQKRFAISNDAEESLYNPRFVMTRGGDSTDLDKSKTLPLYVNSFDHDRFVEQGNVEKPSHLPKEAYVVLLMNHPCRVRDYFFNKTDINSTIEINVYKKIIIRFIEMLEIKLGLEVIIAAHQKATEDENIYNGRLFLNDTEQMVKYAHGVVGHSTGAINFAVIHNKPFCLIGLKCLPIYSDFSIANKYYSDELGVPLHYIDTEKHIHALLKGKIFTINQKSYREYMQKHILSEFNSNKRIWETVSETIEDKDYELKYENNG
jgi:hypothetical protein